MLNQFCLYRPVAVLRHRSELRSNLPSKIPNVISLADVYPTSGCLHKYDLSHARRAVSGWQLQCETQKEKPRLEDGAFLNEPG